MRIATQLWEGRGQYWVRFLDPVWLSTVEEDYRMTNPDGKEDTLLTPIGKEVITHLRTINNVYDLMVGRTVFEFQTSAVNPHFAGIDGRELVFPRPPEEVYQDVLGYLRSIDGTLEVLVLDQTTSKGFALPE